MENVQNKNNASSMELTPEELGRVAYMCYVLNRSWTVRWYHRWCTALEQMKGKGWTWEGLHYRGLVRTKLEELYGLTPGESRTAVRQYPRINLGLEPWQVLTDAVANELTEQIYRAYVGLPAEKGHDYWFVSSCGNANTQCEECDFSYEADPSVMDDETDDDGGFYFT